VVWLGPCDGVQLKWPEYFGDVYLDAHGDLKGSKGKIQSLSSLSLKEMQ
jgi:hypothetical protein